MSQPHEARAVLRDGLHFEAFTDDESPQGYGINLDAHPRVGGQGKGVNPSKMILVALAACMGMDVISILRKKQQRVTGMEVRARGDRASEHPMVYTHILVTFTVTGHQVDRAAVERSIELSFTKYCPVANLLKQAVPIETDYEIIQLPSGDDA